MIARKEPTITQNRNGKQVYHQDWVKKQTLLFEVGNEYKWGFGLNTIRSYDELGFPEGLKLIRGDARNAKKFALKTGAYWQFEATGWHYTDGDTDKGRFIVHVEGYLKREATEAEIAEEKILRDTEVKEEKLNSAIEKEERLLEKLPERRRFVNERYALEIPAQDTVWKVDRILKYTDRNGNPMFGFKLERKDEAIFADLLPEKQKVFRLEAKSVPVKVGQHWNVAVTGLHYTEEYLVYEDGTEELVQEKTQAVYVEGELIAEVKTEAKKEFVRKPKALEEKPVRRFEREPEESFEKPQKRDYRGKKTHEKNEERFSKITLRSQLDEIALNEFKQRVRKGNFFQDE